MINGVMNVEIGNFIYKMYEGGEFDDVGGLLDVDFVLDFDKFINFINFVYVIFYMGGYGSCYFLVSMDEK